MSVSSRPNCLTVCVSMSSIQFVLARHTGIFDQDLSVEINTLGSLSFLMLAG